SVAFGDGTVHAFVAGKFTAVATSFNPSSGAPVTLEIPITVTWPALTKLEIDPQPGRLYTNITLAQNVKGFHADSSERKGIVATWKSSNPLVAKVDGYGNVTGVRPGVVTITAEAEGIKATHRYTV